MPNQSINQYIHLPSVSLQKKDWHTVDVYEMRAWDTKDDTSRGVAAILDVVNIVQQNENVDPENKLLILSRYSLFHFISIAFIDKSPQYSLNMYLCREQIVRSTMRLNVFWY